MSALPPKADIAPARLDVRFGPKAEAEAEAEAEVTKPYSITSSARPRKGMGKTRPSFLAVFILIAKSTPRRLLTGMLAGLAPFRIFPTYTPTNRYASKRLGP